MPGFISDSPLARDLIRIGDEAIAREDDAALRAYFSEDYVFHGPRPPNQGRSHARITRMSRRPNARARWPTGAERTVSRHRATALRARARAVSMSQARRCCETEACHRLMVIASIRGPFGNRELAWMRTGSAASAP